MKDELFRCPACGLEAPWTDGKSIRLGGDVDEFWCRRCGTETPLTREQADRLSALPQMDHRGLRNACLFSFPFWFVIFTIVAIVWLNHK